MPTTLNDYATQEKNTYQTAVTLAQAALKSAQDQLRPAPPAPVPPPPTKADLLETAKKDVKAKEDVIAEKRRQLAVTTVPSQANALIAEITALTLDLNKLQSVALDAKAAVDAESAAAAFAQARLTRATARLAEAEKKLAAVTAATNARTALTAALAGPLAAIPASATTLLASPEFATASGRFDAAHFPDRLLALARERHGLWRNRLDNSRKHVEAATTALGAQEDTSGGLDGDAVKAAIEFAAREADVRRFAGTAKERFDRAQASIQKLALGTDVLTPAELADAFLASAQTDRNTAQTHELALVAAVRAVDNADAKIEDARIVARAAAPNADDPTIDAVAAVAAEIAARAPLAATAGTADTTYTAGERTTMRNWQTIVPPEAWKKLLDFIEAGAALTELAATDIVPANSGSLQGRMNTAEGLYGDALAAAAGAGRAVAFYEDAIAKKEALLEAGRVEENVRLLSAIRGDAI